MNARHSLTCVAVAAALLPGVATAAEQMNEGYLLDSTGSRVVTSPLSGCWRTSRWSAASAMEPCDPVVRAAAPAPAPVAEPAPPPKVAAAPEPAPAPAPVAPPPPQSVDLAADVLFEFDQAKLTPRGEAAIGDIVRQLQGVRYDAIYITGHTDRVGSRNYNQDLSERRANAVKEYMVRSNVPAERIKADGKGESEPVTRADDCKGVSSTEAIRCLQPDRRVNVEMTGIKAAPGGQL